MIFRLMVLISVVVFISCASDGKKNTETTVTPEQVENVEMEDVRIAFLSKKQIQIVLVNKTNSKYLQMNKELEETDYSKLPPTAFEYHAETLVNDPRTSVRIVEDEVMGQLLVYAESEVSFYSFAQATSWQEINSLDKDAILIENGNKLYLLVKDERIRSLQKNKTSPAGKAWAGMKINLIRAPGHIVKTVQKGLGGDYFRRQHMHMNNRMKKNRK